MAYTSINDPVFEKTVTLAEAYRIFEAFVVQYNARGESSTQALMADIGLVVRGESSDPAQLDDFLACARQVNLGAWRSQAIAKALTARHRAREGSRRRSRRARNATGRAEAWRPGAISLPWHGSVVNGTRGPS